MKKQKIKTFLKFGTLLFGISLFLVACQKDDDLQTNSNLFPKKYSPFSITKIGESEILKNKVLSNKLNKLNTTINQNRTASIQNKTVYSSEYDFYIDTEQANFIQIDSTYHSYTFTIKRDYATSIIENLLVSLQQDGSYKMLFVTYNTTAQEKLDIINDINVDLIDKVQYTIIDDDILMSNIFSKDIAGGDCVVIGIGECSNGFSHDHESTSFCDGYTALAINLDCASGGGGGTPSYDGVQIPDYGNPSTGNNGHGGAGGTGNTTNPNITVPTPCTRDCPEKFDYIDVKNCEELHKFSSSAYAQNEFIALKNWVNEDKEKGYFVKASPTAAPNFSTQYGESPSLDDCTEIKVPYSIRGTTYAIMHVHPTGCNEGTYGMFGIGDLRNLYLTSQYYSPSLVPEVGSDPSIYAIYMTVAEYHYAIKINDPTKLANLSTIFSNKEDRENFSTKLADLYKETNNSQTLLEKALLKFMNETYNLGISLYRTSHDDIQVGSSNWKRLTLNNNDIVLKDCN
ncbi:hypothetical protein [Lacinutrix mariniflava]|uniref:hypothetical protein n=1 Tax=Lacinutrix mariniflava TaxID=342955 RepID=UPI0006E33DC5|nr:hypothetical protein [Lacinutrix mariniflava]